MTEKRFRMEIIEGATVPFIVDNDSAKNESDKITSYHTYETHRRDKCQELVDLLNEQHETIMEQDGKIIGLRSKNRALQSIAETQQQLTRLANKYNFQIEDVPDILEEYILIDNEVIEQKNIENTIKEAYNNERTQLGKSVLKQLLETI